MTNEHVVYVVDWDLPVEPPGKRRAFYRRLKALQKDMGLEGSMSTQSVMIVVDKDLAFKVFFLACVYGKANLYEAHPLETSRGGE